MSDLDIKIGGVSQSKVTGGEFLTSDKKLNQMKVKSVHHNPNIPAATYSNGDLLCEGKRLADIVEVKGGSCILQSLTMIDMSDTVSGAVTMIITDNAADLGSVGSAVALHDAQADNCFAVVDMTNFKDLGNTRISIKGNIGIVLEAGANSRDLYYALVNSSGGDIVITSAVDDPILLKVGVICD